MSRNGKKESAEVDASNLPALPDGWCWTTVGDLAHVGTGTTPRRDEARFWREGTVPWITSTAVNDPYVRTAIEYVTEAALGETRLTVYAKHTLIIALYGEGKTRGKVSELLIDATINQALGALVLSGASAACRPFLKMYLHSQYEELRRQAAGAMQPNLNLGMVRSTRVRLAPLPEQRRIVATIEELFSDLDAGVAALRRVQANLKRYRAAVLKAAVEGRLTAEWRKKNRPKETGRQLLARILGERRRKWEEEQLAAFAKAGKTPPAKWKEKYKEPVAPDCTNLPPLPEGWCWTTVDQLCEVGTGTTPSRAHRQFYEGGSIPWVMSTAVNHPFVDQGTELVTQAAVDATTLQLYPVGTLLIALYGEGKTRGMVSELRIPATINQALGALVFRGAAEHVRLFVKVFLASHYVELRRQAAGGMQPNLNLGLVKRIPLPLPTSDEQSQIVCEVSERFSQMEASEGLVEHCLKRSSRLRQAILKQAFEGKLVPQDLTDEPAAALLARIQKQNGQPKPVRKTHR